MADTFKVLGQSLAVAGVLTDLYVVPALTSVTISSIVVANESVNAGTFRISIAVAGVVDNLKQYIYYNVQLMGNKTVALTLGITLGAADVVRVYSSTGNIAFNAFGVEIT